jgi:HK97 family phage major capsid protein
MIRRLEGEIEERNQLIQGMAQDAQSANGGTGRDFESGERETINRARARISELVEQLEPLREASRIAIDARQRAEVINTEIERMRGRGELRGDVEYRSAAAYIADFYFGALGDRDASDRLEVFNRTAAHQITTDNPGLLPEQIVGPLVNFIDSARPVVSSIGTTPLGTGSWAYAKVTQHTLVGEQTSGEKTELSSRKMTITKTSITPVTYGGYVNVSRQDINRTSPQILDMVISDLAAQYAIATEAVACTDLLAGATAGTALDASPSGDEIAAVLWAAVATTYSNVKGAGRVLLAVAPGDLGKFAGSFAPYGATNSQGTGFTAGSFASGAMGTISGIPVVMTPGLSTGQALLINTAGVQLFEQGGSALQVVEPSVWGVQVGYAGDFETVVMQTGSVISIDTVP